MKVQCVLCERIDELDPDTPLAKKLRNHERIKKRTEKRIATGKFRFYRSWEREDDW